MMYMYSKLFSSSSAILFFALLLITAQSTASTPAEMAELSLQELMNLPIEEENELIKPNPQSHKIRKKWSLGLIYSHLVFDGYKNGTKDLKNSEVQFTGVMGTRTDKNFPILPTIITQQALIVNATYRINNKSKINIGIPYIRQSTDHESIVGNYEFFNITSSGLGDISTHYKHQLRLGDKDSINLTFGLSTPTGSIDKQGDTPRAAGDQQLPYTMQLGSGTWDIPMGITHLHQQKLFNLNTQILGKYRLGENDRNYTLGNRISLSSLVKLKVHKNIFPSFKVNFLHWGKIDGQDDEITIPAQAPFIYPANITNPDYFGGEKINVTLGITLSGEGSILHGHQFEIKAGKPIYQNLNGIQHKESYHLNVNWTANF